MERALRNVLLVVLGALAADRAAAQPADDSAAENQCVLCHANPDIWEKETLHLFVTPQDLADMMSTHASSMGKPGKSR